MVFVGNTQHTVPFMLKHSDLFDELPDSYHDSAFLDRMHFYIPGWEMDIIRGEMFSDGYGFVVDYIAEVLRHLRSHDFSNIYTDHLSLFKDISTRDRDAVHKTFSGLVKLLFPSGEASTAELEELMTIAIEGRKRVKDQLMRIDSTYAKVRFGYHLKNGTEKLVTTLEETQFPAFYYPKPEASAASEKDIGNDQKASSVAKTNNNDSETEPMPGHCVFQENQKGVTFSGLFGSHLKGAKKILITDPYLRAFYQMKNLMELIDVVAEGKEDTDEVEVQVITSADEYKSDSQEENLSKIQQSCSAIGIQFSWKIDTSNSIHARHIVTDTGWKILLDRGLDIYQPYEMKDAFSITNRLQRTRACKMFEVTYLKESK